MYVCLLLVNSIKYLGEIFDEKLKLKSHIHMLKIRLRKCFYIFEDLQYITLDIPSL